MFPVSQSRGLGWMCLDRCSVKKTRLFHLLLSNHESELLIWSRETETWSLNPSPFHQFLKYALGVRFFVCLFLVLFLLTGVDHTAK